MFLVLAKETLFEDTKQTKQPSQKRHLENNAHNKDEHREIVDVALKVDLVGNVRTQIVLNKEAEGEWEDECVTDGTADVEHKSASKEGWS